MFSHFTSTIAADIMRTSVRDTANEIDVYRNFEIHTNIAL